MENITHYQSQFVCNDEPNRIREPKPKTNFSVNVHEAINNHGYWQDEFGRIIVAVCLIEETMNN